MPTYVLLLITSNETLNVLFLLIDHMVIVTIELPSDVERILN